MTRSPLAHYFAVLGGKEEPHYLISKRTRAKKPRNLEDAWVKHAESLAGTEEGEFSLLGLKSYIAEKIIESCTFCEHKCKVNRQKKRGFCNISKDSYVSSAFVHLGEEPELVPSGTIFFSGCNLRCSFCQNWDISTNSEDGYKWSPEMLASWVSGMRNGIANVNFVGGEPSPHLGTIINALLLLEAKIPIVWNSNMYMSEETMSLLGGIVDLYLSDFKYGNDSCAEELSGVKNYFSVVSRNHLLANKQSNLLIRHLVLPGHIECCSKPILDWIAKNLGPETRVNIMDQYRPEHKANGKIGRRLSRGEHLQVVKYAKKIGLRNLEPVGRAADYLVTE
ncbi:MAG: radical SAM protein [Candidatus Micrarchaeota archaeon]